MKQVRVAAVIPARMASSRFPGKPLLEVRGLPMVEHVRRRSLLCREFSDVVVATCDWEIAAVIETFGGKVILTSSSHPGATDRVAEAAQKLDCTHVVNVQGDEILMLPEHLDRMVEAISRSPDVLAWNALAQLSDPAELSDTSIVKCVVSISDRILYCSRTFPQTDTMQEGLKTIRVVLGLLGYQRSFLKRYSLMPRTPLEAAQSIDQFRIIEHDVALHGVCMPESYPGINEPREIPIIERALNEDPAQAAVLRRILSSETEKSLAR